MNIYDISKSMTEEIGSMLGKMIVDPEPFLTNRLVFQSPVSDLRPPTSDFKQ